MFPIKYVGLIVFIWIVGAIFGATLDAAIPLQEGKTSDLNILMNFGIVESQQSWGPVGFVAPIADFFGALYRILTFQFSFIYGSWIYVKWIILAPIIATVVFGLVILFISLFTRAL